MNSGVLAIHFGEPERPAPDAVEAYLTEIFYRNADLEGASTDAEARERARELARRRTPSLVAEYEAIGGSPLNAQARGQAQSLEERLADRGHDVPVSVGFQFLSPSIGEAIEDLRADGVDHLVALPVYPLCGPSTTVAALHRVGEATVDTDVSVSPIAGWHRHPRYLRLRAENLQDYLTAEDLSVDGEETVLVCSAHGTPVHYLEEGSRYVRYVEEFCETLAALAGIEEYALGYQNHENRDIPWTEPDVEDVIGGLGADRVVVEPVSFMHEQSETLGELDDELAELAAECDLGFYRVPIPHDDSRFPDLLADLVEPFLAGVDPSMFQLRACECAADADAYCLNAPRR